MNLDNSFTNSKEYIQLKNIKLDLKSSHKTCKSLMNKMIYIILENLPIS